MTHEKLIKLFQGTKDDFAIACYWLVEHHNPIEYIEKHGNLPVDSPNCHKSISWNNDWDGRYEIGRNTYYKYKDKEYIIRCGSGVTVTNHNYDDSAEVIIH